MRPFLALVTLSAVACASAPPARVPDPVVTGDAFLGALCAGKPDAAWAQLDPSLRAADARARFDAQWEDNRAEIEALCAHVERTDAARVARARVELVDGEVVVLVLEDGRWHIDGGLLDAQALGTPLDTVQELRRALQRRSLPALLRLLARERRAAWTATLERSLEGSSDPLDLEVDVQGDAAVVKLTGGGEVHLRREGDTWRIWDVK